MAEDMEKAKQVYQKLIAMLDARDWHYERDDEKMAVKAGIKGDDLPIHFTMSVRPDMEIVQIMSWMPFEVPEDKRVDIAIAVCVANYTLAQGCFDFSIENGNLLFRMTTNYMKSELSDDLLEHIIFLSAATVDRFNDKFFMVTKGMLSIDDFIKQVG